MSYEENNCSKIINYLNMFNISFSSSSGAAQFPSPGSKANQNRNKDDYHAENRNPNDFHVNSSCVLF